MSETSAPKRERPLSPHLQVYKPQMTSVTSILHRATGLGMAYGLAVFAWWLISASIGSEAYSVFTGFMASKIGLLLMFGWTIAFYYHMANGIRHLIWDSGFLFKIKNAYAAGYLVLFLTIAFTAMTWFCLIVYKGVSL